MAIRDDERIVAALDAQFQQAVKENDVVTMDRILADDFVLVTGRGKIFIKSARGEYVGRRFSSIQANEVILQVQKGEATADVIIPFPEIFEVHVRPRTA